jgi:hypothetical protein
MLPAAAKLVAGGGEEDDGDDDDGDSLTYFRYSSTTTAAAATATADVVVVAVCMADSGCWCDKLMWCRSCRNCCCCCRTRYCSEMMVLILDVESVADMSADCNHMRQLDEVIDRRAKCHMMSCGIGDQSN